MIFTMRSTVLIILNTIFNIDAKVWIEGGLFRILQNGSIYREEKLMSL